MDKTIKSFLVLAIGAVAMSFTSCSSDDDANNVPTQKEIETKIIGKWKVQTKDGQEFLTNNRVVFTFKDNHQFFLSMSRVSVDGETYWQNNTLGTYDCNDDTLIVAMGTSNSAMKINYIDDKIFNSNEGWVIMPNGQKYPNPGDNKYTKVTADYSQDIIGLWEGVEMTGYETYGNAEARIEYRADGSYTYYNKVDNYWVPSDNVDNEYNVDGDWLATRWRPEAGAEYNYEWWDIDNIKDGIMKWSALREKEDGTRFTTTFTWKKIEVPSQKEIEEKIIGKWKTIGMDGKDCPTNNRGVFTYNPDGTYSSSLYNEYLPEYLWDSYEHGTYSITDNVITQVHSDKGVTTSSDIYAITDNYFVEHSFKIFDGSQETKTNTTYIQKKVTADFSQDIIGLWEGVEMTGNETYGNDEARIEYHADGTYTYYNKVNGEWIKSTNVGNEYNVDGDWLAFRWCSEAGANYNHEWWDIDYIKGDEMKWSALREKEDGTRFTTTFTWKKIVE